MTCCGKIFQPADSLTTRLYRASDCHCQQGLREQVSNFASMGFSLILKLTVQIFSKATNPNISSGVPAQLLLHCALESSVLDGLGATDTLISFERYILSRFFFLESWQCWSWQCGSWQCGSWQWMVAYHCRSAPTWNYLRKGADLAMLLVIILQVICPPLRLCD